MTYKLFHHSYHQHMVQTLNDNFCNGLLLDLMEYLLFDMLMSSTSHNITMVCLNYKISLNIIILLANLVWPKFSIFHGASHSQCMHFPIPTSLSLNFFIYVIVFYKPIWTSFTYTKIVLIKNLSSFVAYWHILNITCPKQVPHKHTKISKIHN